jgi:hypothetical protein
MGALSAVGEGVRPYTASLAIPAGRPYSCRGSLCSAGFPGRLNVTALLGSMPAAPQPNHHLGKADLGRGHTLIEAQPPRQPQTPASHSGSRDKGCLIMSSTWRYINWCNDALSSSQIVLPGVATFEHYERLIYFVANLYILRITFCRKSVATIEHQP